MIDDFLRLVGGAKSDGSEAPAMSGHYAAAGAIPAVAYCAIGGRQYQADAGSCTAHGYSAAVESWANKVVKADLQLCRQDIYYTSRLVEGNGAERIDGGAFPSMVRKALRELGTVTEARKPYNAHDVTTWRRPVEWNADALLLAPGFDRIPNDVEAMLPFLADGTPVVLCHAVYPSLFNLLPGGLENAAGTRMGGHCRIAVGYDLTRDDHRGALLVMNSWKGWGLPHPAKDEDARFAGYTDSFSWVPFPVVNDAKWLDDAAVLAVPPVGIES